MKNSSLRPLPVGVFDSFQSPVIYSACGNGFVCGKLKLLLSAVIIKSGSLGAVPVAGANLMKWGEGVKRIAI